MKPNGSSAFGQAFAAAEQKKTEESSRKTPIYLIVGLDFGTAFTKCMVRDFNYRRATPVEFELDENSTHLVPSRLGWHAGKMFHPLDQGIAESVELPFIKMALASAATGTASDWLDGITRPLGIDDSRLNLESIQALVVFYIERILRDVHEWIQERWADFGSLAGDTIYYNMAVPVAQAREGNIIDAFRECLDAAVGFLRSHKIPPANLNDCIVAMNRFKMTRIPECELIPEVTANVQSYVRSRGGREGIYLFADVGAGTVDFSVFIYYEDRGDKALSYPHAAVEHLGSSQLEIRAFHRLQTALTNALRQLKEGALNYGTCNVKLTDTLAQTSASMGSELTEVTARVLGLTRRKVRRIQFQTMQILYGGGGCSETPYQIGIQAAFDPRFGLKAESQPLPVPEDVDWPDDDGTELFKRFSVAYGLSFLPTDQPIQHFPDEIREFDPATDHPSRNIPAAPSKDEC
jgi:hypothetical protein